MVEADARGKMPTQRQLLRMTQHRFQTKLTPHQDWKTIHSILLPRSTKKNQLLKGIFRKECGNLYLSKKLYGVTVLDNFISNHIHYDLHNLLNNDCKCMSFYNLLVVTNTFESLFICLFI